MAKEKKSGGTSFSTKLAILILLLAAGVFFPSTVLLCGCMLPTFVAALVDTHPQKTAGITVGTLNLACSMPAWLTLLDNGHRLDNTLLLLMQPSTLLLAYAGAALGWVIYFNVPLIVGGYLLRKSEKRLKTIEKRQKELIRKWGAEVGGDKV